MIIGIDAGITGAVTFYDPSTHFIEIYDIPTKALLVAGKTKAGNPKKRKQIDFEELMLILRMFKGRLVRDVIIEKVHATPNDGAIQAFNFGRVYGEITGLCYGMGFNIVTCSPQAWKREFDLLGTDKDTARQLAIEIFQTDYFKYKKHHNRADSALIAAYGHKMLSQNLQA